MQQTPMATKTQRISKLNKAARVAATKMKARDSDKLEIKISTQPGGSLVNELGWEIRRENFLRPYLSCGKASI